MTTTTERRAGQVWEFDFDGRFPGQTYTLTQEKNGAWWATDRDGRESCFASEREFAEMPHMFRLVSVPAAAPLAADRCKAPEWCGYQVGIVGTMRDAFLNDLRPFDGVTANSRAFCSPACRDARLPPLAAQPAETKPIKTCSVCEWAEPDCVCSKPAPQPAPAKVEQPGLVVAAPCDDCGETDDVEWFQFDNMTRVYCQPCRIGATVWMAAQTGTPYTGPERLERPKLAHSFGVECPTLEDC